jgi:hypothetical protein
MHGRVHLVGLAGCLSLALLVIVQSYSVDILLEHDLQGSFQKGGYIRGTLAPQVVIPSIRRKVFSMKRNFESALIHGKPKIGDE